MKKICSNCGPTAAESDGALGITYCTNCGSVLEQNEIVSQIEFSSSSGVQGLSISNSSARQKSSSKFSTQVSSERVLDNGNSIISQISVGLKFSPRHVEAAQRYYALAANASFNKGRRSQVVCAACLYLVCRVEKTSHLLIDFADALHINVYVLGAAFIKLSNLLSIKVMFMDPVLYIARYAAKLDFKEKTQKVVTDSIRLVQRMKRDWISIGRRPSGVCAAALFIAARMSGFQRSYHEIIYTVKICEQTLKKRLDEIKKTPSGQLSVVDYNNIDLEENADPPSFSNPAKRKRLVEEIDDDPFATTLATIDEEDEDDDPFAEHINALENPNAEDKEHDQNAAFAEEEEEVGVGEEVAIAALKEAVNDIGLLTPPLTNSSPEISKLTLSQVALDKAIDDDPFDFDIDEDEDLNAQMMEHMQDPHAEKVMMDLEKTVDDCDEGNLQDLDDDPEIQNALLCDHEVEFKKTIWLDENSSWLKSQSKVKAKETKKRIKKAKMEEEYDEDSKQPKKSIVSKRINYEILDSMFDE